MNAKEAKAQAHLNKTHTEEAKRIREEKLKNSDVALLYKHLHDKIESAVAEGKLSTSSAGQTIEFPHERFSNSIINEVADLLRAEEYNLSMTTHNAYNKIKFEISWA
jgi:hypothetical protein